MLSYSWPRLHQTGQQFGIPTYAILSDHRTVKFALPNTFQSYVKIRVNATIK